MNFLSSPGRRWVAAAVAIWLIVVAYIGAGLLLVSRYQPKLIADRDGAGAVDSVYQTIGGRAYWLLAPVWQYDRYVIPLLLLIAVAFTIVARAVRRRERVAV